MRGKWGFKQQQKTFYSWSTGRKCAFPCACATRLRFTLNDRSKADKDKIEALDDVVTVAESGGQFQVVIGNLDADDQTYGDHILIVDIKTGKAILNYYYASGVESLPVISYIQ